MQQAGRPAAATAHGQSGQVDFGFGLAGENGRNGRPRMQASAVRGVIGWGCQGPGPVPPRDLCSRQRVAESQTTFPQSCRIRFSARAWALRPSIFRCKIWNVSQSGDGTVRQWQARQAFRPNERRRPSLSSKIHASWQQPFATPVKLPHLLPPLAHTHTHTHCSSSPAARMRMQCASVAIPAAAQPALDFRPTYRSPCSTLAGARTSSHTTVL